MKVDAIFQRIAPDCTTVTLDFQAIYDFEKKYRSQVGSSHSSITPPNFDSARKLPIDELFVTPRVCTIPRTKKEERQMLTMESFFSRAFRAVLLGNPGGGKSTLSLKLCHDLATHYPDIEFAGRKQLTPILIILREYGADKKERKCSILEFIETEAKATYQLTAPPPRTFEYLLLSGRAMIIFDGLDELLDTTYRQEIRDDVEAFCRYYPSVPVLIISREIGYEQAPLDEKMFETYRLAEFDDKQVEEYVEKWFNIEDREVAQKQRKKKIETFLKESMIVPDLRSNPLMLALLCNIYRGESYIPRNRPEVYDKCATMLFERWDKSRGLYVPPVLEEHMRPLMEYLAQWIFEDEILRKGVTEQELVAKATEYLNEWVFENIYKAERVSLDFIQFCTVGRAWVFLDTGTKKEGEKLYQFAHSTFLEYFTASYFVRKYRTPDRLVDALLDRIAKREWDVMAQLAFQLQSKRISGAADELLMALVTAAVQDKSERGTNWLSFTIRCLQFIAPRPKVVRSIVEAWMKHFIPILKSDESVLKSSRRITAYTPDKLGHQRRQLFWEMLDAALHNYEVVVDTLEKQLIEPFNREGEAKSLYAWEVLSFFLTFSNLVDQEKEAIYSSARNRIIDSCLNRILEFSQHNFRVCRDAIDLGIVHIADFIKWHGIHSIFLGRDIPMFAVGIGSLYWNLLYSFLSPNSYLGVNDRLDNLKEMGRVLLSIQPPWFEFNTTRQIGRDIDLFRMRHWTSELHQKTISFDSDVFFAGIVLLAPLSELDLLFTSENEIIIQSTTLGLIKSILLARHLQKPVDKVQFELDRCELSTEQQKFVWSWVRKEIHLVQVEKLDGVEKEEMPLSRIKHTL